MANQRGRKKSVAADTKSLYEIRFEKKVDELRWLYMELYACIILENAVIMRVYGLLCMYIDI